MCDRITYCDVCECAECPRYGDDCDGDKRNDDLISRADAIEAVCGVVIDEFDVSPTRGYEVAEKALFALSSAEPSTGELISREEPTVIRSRTFMPTKDFKEWAKRIREVNPNAVVIPCDAEVVSAEAEEHRIYKDGYNTGKAHASADAVQGWIPCSERLPDVGEDVILQFRDNQCVGNRYSDYDEDGWVINSGGNWVTPILDGDEEPIAWMPLPTPYKGGDDDD